MQVVNNTAFPSIGWVSSDSKENNYVTVLSRVKYLFDTVDDEGLWTLKLDPEQDELFSTDVFYNGHEKELQFESDFVPYKKQADFIINQSKGKREFGKRGVKVWRYTSSLSDSSVTKKSLLKHMSFKNFGFVHRSDKKRMQWVGTLDESWIKNKAPVLPSDFDEKHYNAAHSDMQLDNSYFEPGDVIELHKVLPGQHKQMVMVPGVYLKAVYHKKAVNYPLLLEADTVIFNIEALDMTKNSIYVSYRNRMFTPEKIDKVSINMLLEKSFIEKGA